MTKEKLHTLYRCKGFNRVKQSLMRLVDWSRKDEDKRAKNAAKNTPKSGPKRYCIPSLCESQMLEPRRLTTSVKLVQSRAYELKSFRNYRLKVLDADLHHEGMRVRVRDFVIGGS